MPRSIHSINNDKKGVGTGKKLQEPGNGFKYHFRFTRLFTVHLASLKRSSRKKLVVSVTYRIHTWLRGWNS